jgi:hypothetical protein
VNVRDLFGIFASAGFAFLDRRNQDLNDAAADFKDFFVIVVPAAALVCLFVEPETPDLRTVAVAQDE